MLFRDGRKRSKFCSVSPRTAHPRTQNACFHAPSRQGNYLPPFSLSRIQCNRDPQGLTLLTLAKVLARSASLARGRENIAKVRRIQRWWRKTQHGALMFKRETRGRILAELCSVADRLANGIPPSPKKKGLPCTLTSQRQGEVS